MKIVLLGYMGCGKSWIGKKLAQELKMPFVDLDARIEAEEGRTITSIFSEMGEIYFRKRENAILKKLVSANGNMVLATGGGTPCYADSMTFLSMSPNVVTLYLKCTVQTLAKRLNAQKDHRPLIAHLKSEEAMEDYVRKHLFERSHYYNQAQFQLSVDTLPPEEIVDAIKSKLF